MDPSLPHPENEAVEYNLGSNLGRQIIPRAIEDNEYDGGDLNLDQEKTMMHVLVSFSCCCMT